MRKLCPKCQFGERWKGCANPTCEDAGKPIVLVDFSGGQLKTKNVATIQHRNDCVTYRRTTVRTPNGLIWLWVPVETPQKEQSD